MKQMCIQKCNLNLIMGLIECKNTRPVLSEHKCASENAIQSLTDKQDVPFQIKFKNESYWNRSNLSWHYNKKSNSLKNIR